MKVAVYAIALNEEQFVERWYESAKDADYLLICDTGSTDRTVEIAESLGIHVQTAYVRPWRFDIARNISLGVIPLDIDYCIALDMDEILLPGWREALEPALEQGWTRPRYQYTWNWNEDGSPGLTYGGDKIHHRQGYRWKHPVHEVITRYGSEPETQGWVGLEIHHHADNTKSRSQYFPMLEMAVAEDPEDDRNAFYLAREYYYYGLYDKAIPEFKRHLSLPRAAWPPERAASMRFLAKMIPEEREDWLMKAIAQAPGRREPWVDLANHYYSVEDWPKCLAASQKALEITEKPLEYLCEAEAWGAAPHDYAAISSYRLGNFVEAVKYGSEAQRLSPGDSRLAVNLMFYRKAIEESQS